MPDDTAFRRSEERMERFFSSFKKQVRRFRAEDVVMAAVSHLHAAQTHDQIRHYPPWFLLLLIKWTFLHGRVSRPNAEALSEAGFNGLVNLVHEFSDAAITLTEYDDWLLFFKASSHQQFYLQHELPSRSGVARQHLLFVEMNRSDAIESTFAACAGLPIPAFVDLSSLLLGYFVDRGSRNISERELLEATDFQPDHIRSFLEALSLPFTSLRPFLREASDLKLARNYELLAESPLRRKPLLRLAEAYVPYGRALLRDCLETYVYDQLREHDAEGFMRRFGPLFEDYVGVGVRGTGLPWVGEAAMRQALPCGSKVVDFLVVDGDANVLIDAKGVEMPVRGRMSHRQTVMKGRIKSSILRGVGQGRATAEALRALPKVASVELGNGPWYTLVVTHKPMYVGSGRLLSRIVGHAGLVRPSAIPLERMFFLSADDFDFLVSAVQRGNSLADILSEAVEADARAEFWTFSQHVAKYDGGDCLPRHLEDAFKRHRRRVLGHLRR